MINISPSLQFLNQDVLFKIANYLILDDILALSKVTKTIALCLLTKDHQNQKKSLFPFLRSVLNTHYVRGRAMNYREYRVHHGGLKSCNPNALPLKQHFKPEQYQDYEAYKTEKLIYHTKFFSNISKLDWRDGCCYQRQLPIGPVFYSAYKFKPYRYAMELPPVEALSLMTRKSYGWTYIHWKAFKSLGQFPHVKSILLKGYVKANYDPTTKEIISKDFLVFGLELESLKRFVSKLCTDLKNAKIHHKQEQCQAV